MFFISDILEINDVTCMIKFIFQSSKMLNNILDNIKMITIIVSNQKIIFVF